MCRRSRTIRYCAVSVLSIIGKKEKRETDDGEQIFSLFTTVAISLSRVHCLFLSFLGFRCNCSNSVSLCTTAEATLGVGPLEIWRWTCNLVGETPNPPWSGGEGVGTTEHWHTERTRERGHEVQQRGPRGAAE